MLDEPNTSVTSGGQLVAPVVRNIFNDILPYLGVVPQYTPEELANLEISVPNVIGSDVKTAKTELSNAGFTYRIEGEGQTVVDQVPKTGERLSKGSSIILYTCLLYTSRVQLLIELGEGVRRDIRSQAVDFALAFGLQLDVDPGEPLRQGDKIGAAAEGSQPALELPPGKAREKTERRVADAEIGEHH